MMAKRQVDVFTSGCAVCAPAVRLVEELTCPDCEVTVHDVRQSGGVFTAFTGDAGPAERAAGYGVKTIPAVVVDGRLVSCCDTGGPTRDQLAAARIGHRL